MTSANKRKISVTIDAELLDELEKAGVNVSAQINEALSLELDRRRRQAALAAMLDEMAAERGPLDSADDEALIRHYMRLLGGPSAAAAAS
ncbi:type II toxin-antitoxin system CcdA family antitoxin [Fodinicola acaciae]|uniref:type II toxin-antitoxin system CcdA family antitoxin n=1 Tax=Fodinicola acaciae TaxID=2681555 RepID=UPI0013D5E2D6|nr:type II toxin-antitoxin system CcdA family antitoxin [Fodinicola acaciae]